MVSIPQAVGAVATKGIREIMHMNKVSIPQAVGAVATCARSKGAIWYGKKFQYRKR